MAEPSRQFRLRAVFDGLTETTMRFADTLLTALLCGQGLLGLAAITIVALKTPANAIDATGASVTDAR